MRAEELVGLPVENHFHQALILPKCYRFAIASERKASDANVELPVLRALLRQSDGSHLWIAVCAAGNHLPVHRMRMQPLDRLDANDALMLRLVREHRRACNVADGVDAGYVGLAERINDDTPALGLYAKLFKTKSFDVADDADGGDDAVSGDLFYFFLAVVDRRGDVGTILVELRHFRAGQDLDPLILEGLARKSGNLSVLDRQNLRQDFDDGHFHAHGAVERRKL